MNKIEVDFTRFIVRNHHFHFQGAIHAYLTGDNFEEVVRQTIKAGGCNCSRALFAGAMAGATYGIKGIPIDWMRKTRFTEAVLEACLISL